MGFLPRAIFGARALVARIPTMTTTWKGRARLSVASDGTAYFVDQDNHELFTVGDKGVVRKVRAFDPLQESAESLRETHADSADNAAAEVAVANATCHIEGWVFPAMVCR